jgi:preprotein translocase subunit SecB
MSNEQQNNQQAKQNDTDEKEFAIQKIYIKDVSFETPNSPAIFTQKWEPNINLELSTNGKHLGEGVHEVVLTVTVTAKIEDKTAYLAEAHQAGVFKISGIEGQELAHALGSYCPNILFPFVREVISDLVTKGGFPQLLLTPVNFDALFAQHMQRMQEQQSNQTEEGAVH